MIPHKLCRMVGNFDMSHFGFLSEANPNSKRGDWLVGTGTCDCDCTTCQKVHGKNVNGRTFFITRFTPTGSQVAKVTIIADGSEGIA